MASDYAAIRTSNERRYGTDIGRIGPLLLADRYDDRTHFIYELLQNAEDALARRGNRRGPRKVTFTLSPTELRFSHFGAPFTEADVKGICGIAESTKNLISIGRFGIGFKAVHAYTDRPEIHSDDEHFAIENFVWPSGIPIVHTKPGETIFVFPLRQDDHTAASEISRGLKHLGVRVLLFLREIEEVSWSVEGGISGSYTRHKPEVVGDNVRRVMLLGKLQGEVVTRESWLLFSRPVQTFEGQTAGYTEIAFALGKRDGRRARSIQPIDDSTLVAFFPTILSTNLGFLVQGPYRTTPSRDNVPRDDKWNRHLVKETASLLIEALSFLRHNDMLTVDALRCLPLDRAKFTEGSLFEELFLKVRKVLCKKALIPRFGDGYVAGSHAKLARTQELRSLLNRKQLTELLGEEHRLGWVSEDVTQDRTPELRRYLMQELRVAELTPEAILLRLTKMFLEAQPDEWIVRLYEFLNGQPALRPRLKDIPLVRLEEGKHVVACSDGRSQAFLPGAVESGFPTVRRSVCATEEAMAFLKSLGLGEPDPVDDVIRNVLPRYADDEVDVDDDQYAADIDRILKAFSTDSKAQRDKLITALRESTFVIAVDAGDGSKWFTWPSHVYLATQRFKELFEGVHEVLLVDDSYQCLRGEDARELLEACGATRYLQPEAVNSQFGYEQLRDMRRQGGCESCSTDYGIEDFGIRGLDELIARLPALSAEEAAQRAKLLWNALGDVEDRRGAKAFSGTYRWFYFNQRSYEFDAAFVRQLNEAAWVPDQDDNLQPPSCVVFEETGWKGNPFLLSKIHFKPAAIEALAKEAGIEPGVLDLLKKLGVTSVSKMKEKFSIVEDEPQPEAAPEDDELTMDEALAKLGIPATEPPAQDFEPAPEPGSGNGGGHRPGVHVGEGGNGGPGSGAARPGGGGHPGTTHGGKGAGGGNGSRPFISYVGAHQEDGQSDPDGLEHEARMELEAKAIELILRHEPELKRTPPNNPGYDLYAAGPDGKPVRWVEVKAMTGDLHGRSATLSDEQFECSQAHGENFSIYIVEHAGSPEARIVRIKDPAGKARTFTFDHGWLSVAEITKANATEEAEEIG